MEKLLAQRSQLIAASRYQVQVAEALQRIAGYKPNPTLHVGMEQVPLRSPVAGSVPRLFATNSDAGANPVYTAQFSKVLERGGKRELRTQQAQAVTEAARAQVLDAFRQQLFQLRQAFANALLARRNVELLEAIDKDYEQTETLTVIRVKAGDLAEVDVHRIRAGRIPLRAAVLDARNAYALSVRDVMSLLDLGGTADRAKLTSAGEFEFAGELPPAPTVPSLERLKEIALQERPDVATARSNLEAARAALKLAEAQRHRDLVVGTAYQRVGEDDSVGVTVDIPLFVYNNQRAGIAQAVAQEKIAAAQLRQAEVQATTDVGKAYQALLIAQETLRLYSDTGVNESRLVQRTISYSYQRGEASLFELIEARRTLSQAGVAANQAQTALRVALWQIEQAIGKSLP